MLLFLVEHFFHKRLVIAKETFNQVKPRCQSTFLVDIGKTVRESKTHINITIWAANADQ